MRDHGFTLIELSVSLVVMSLILTGTIVLISAEADSARQSETVTKLMMFKKAIVGDSRIVTKEARTDFGYVGDMGSLPSSLQDLWVGGSQPAYVYDGAKKTGGGWAGPYMDVGPLAFSGDVSRDAWGNPVEWVVQTGTSSATGQEYRARIISYGADGAAGGSDDLTVEIYTTELLSTILGYARDSSGNPMPNIQAMVNYPVYGVLTTALATSSANGSYTFSGIPFGNRSITIEPKLVYSDGTGVTFNDGEDVEFVMISFTCGTITSATATFGSTAYFEQFRISNDTLFNSTTDLAGSGETVNFSSPYDVSWSACGGGTGLSQVHPIRVQSAFTQVPDLDIGAGASGGKAYRFRMNNFESLENGSGTRLDMNGTSIMVTLSNGSVATFTPVPN